MPGRLLLLLPADSVIRNCLFAGAMLAAASGAIFPARASAQEEEEEQGWRWAQFTTESGLPSDRVTGVCETADGTPWAAAGGELAWYDGFQWTGVQQWPGRPAGAPVTILTPEGDSLLVLAGRTLAVGTRAGFHAILPDLVVDDAVPFGEPGSFLLVSHSSLFLYSKGLLTPYAPMGGLSEGKALNVWLTGNGSYWLNLMSGLYRYEGGTWVEKIPAGSSALAVQMLVENKNGEGILFMDLPFEKRGLWEWDRQRPLPERNATEVQFLGRALSIGPQGEVLAAYVSGEMRIRQYGRWRSLPFRYPRIDDVLTIQYRNNGDAWVGTEHGLFLWKRSSSLWSILRHPSPDARNSVNEILFTHDGALWLATNDGVEVRRSDGSSDHINRIGRTMLYTVTGLAEDAEGRVWISSGSSFEGVFRCDDGLRHGEGKWTYFPVLPRESDSTSVKIHKIRKDRRGRLWFLGIGKYFQNFGVKQPGAFVYEDGRFTRWGMDRGLLSGRIYAFAEGLDGAYWFGTYGGLSRWKAGVWKHFSMSTGLPNNRIFALAVDKQNRVWFGSTGQTEGLGYIEPEDGTIRTFSTADGLVDNDIWDIQVDSVGRVWVACKTGLSCYDRGVWVTFDRRSGIGHAPLWPVLPHGADVYVGTMGQGVAILHWNGELMPPPRIVIDRTTMEGQNTLIRWKAFSYWGEPSPGDILCRYRVNDRPWSPWARNSEAVESRLSWGQYTVEVQAKNLLGNYSQKGTRTAFFIPPPLYFQPLFMLPTGGLILAVAALGVVLLVRKRRHDGEIRKSEAKFRAVSEMTPSALFIYHDSRFLFVNPGAGTLTGYAEAELLGMRLRDLIHPDHRDLVEAQERMRSGTTAVPHRMEFRIVTKSGEERWIDYAWGWIRFQGEPATLGTAFDITERKRAEEKLRALTSELSMTEERERRRMATFLHDVIGQTLALCKIKVRGLQKSGVLQAEGQNLEELRGLIEESIHQTQELTFELCPPILYELSFESAIEWLTERLERQHGIHFSFESDKEPKRLPIDMKIVLFQALREILINAIKHAEAGHIRVSTVRDGDCIRIDILDDGVGFDVAAGDGKQQKSSSGGGFGLFNVRERLSHLGGTLAVQSVKGRGTRVSLGAPLSKDDAPAPSPGPLTPAQRIPLQTMKDEPS